MEVLEFEALLGPPDFAQALELDEREEFPQPLVSRLVELGYPSWMVPLAHGGKLARFDQALSLQRCVARRDLTAAIAAGQSFLGTIPVWLAGSEHQRERMARLLLRGGSAALALTEEEHGSDVLATETRAEPGWKLHGRKWLINNATRGEALSVFARTDPAGGLSGFTIFLLEKPCAGLVHLPKIRTHGIRGADISGVVLDGAPAEPIGTVGSGVDLVLKSLQVTRVGCAAFSLGAADTALRLALDFALERRLYGAPVIEIGHARSLLAGAFADLLLCEAAALGAARAVQAAPGQLPLWSAAVKYFVPTTCERAIRAAAVVLGARHYLRQGPFQKVLRDASVVSLFDGSTAVALDSIGVQLPRLEPARAADVRPIFALDEALPPLDGSRFELLNNGRDDVLQSAPHPRIAAEFEALRAEAASLPREKRKRSAELFELAKRYCALHAAASCAHLMAHNPRLQPLDVCIARALGEPADLESLVPRMLELHRTQRPFSLLSP